MITYLLAGAPGYPRSFAKNFIEIDFVRKARQVSSGYEVMGNLFTIVNSIFVIILVDVRDSCAIVKQRVQDHDINDRPLLNLYNRKIKERILEVQTEIWKQNMLTKSSLDLYGKGKTSRGVPSGLYDNRRGSALLALAWAYMLPTRTHKMNSGSDKTCPRCGIYEETVKHNLRMQRHLLHRGKPPDSSRTPHGS